MVKSVPWAGAKLLAHTISVVTLHRASLPSEKEKYSKRKQQVLGVELPAILSVHI